MEMAIFVHSALLRLKTLIIYSGEKPEMENKVF